MNRDEYPYNKHIWEGWTVGDFIHELELTFNIIQKGSDPFTTTLESKHKLKEWVKNEQPYYKKHVPEVYRYFLNKSKL